MPETRNLKSISVLLTLLMLFTSVATLAVSASDDTSARSTGNESLDVEVNDIYYERGSGIAVTITLTNLDPNSEYTLDWELCTAQYDQCELYNQWDAMGGSDPATTEGSIDIGSGNMFTTSLFTFSDPGLVSYDSQTGAMSGIHNHSYYFEASLSIQGVLLTSNISDDFILGGEMGTNSYIDDNSNILKNTNIPFSGRFNVDYHNLNILEYGIDCGLYEDGNTIPVDTISFENVNFYHSYTYFGSQSNSSNNLAPTATSGTHHIECTLTRNYDSTMMGRIIGNDFEVIDADSTGTENLIFSTLSPLYADRTTTSITSQISFDINFEDLFPGQSYTFDWELCTAQYDQCELYNQWDAMGGSDPTATEGQITFSASSSSHVESFTFTDPGVVEYDSQTGAMSGINNHSYYFDGSLSIQGVPLTSNISDDFILGGEMGTNSYIDDNSNVLKNTNIPFSGRFNVDYHNINLLEYDIDCGLYEDGNTIPVDTISFENVNFYHSYTYFGSQSNSSNNLAPTATSGTHHIECTLTRNYDSTMMGRIIGNDFDVIDDTANQDDASITVSVDMHADEQYANVTIIGIDLDAGQEYKFDWTVHDFIPLPPVVLMENDHIWVEGNDGVETYILNFHDLPDTSNACITVVFSAGGTELETVSNVCWVSASIADEDGDGVYDKNDLCENTPTGSVVQADGCSDSDGDGFDSNYEIDCNSDPNDIASIPSDLDNDGICDAQDEDIDGDGYLNLDETLAGTDPLDGLNFPANRLPTCALYYSLEVDGIPTTFEGDAVIPALSGVSAQIGLASITPSVITIPAGSYYMTAHCIDLDGDDITLTVNDITIGPVAGEVSAGALIVIGESVNETIDVTISWTDGSDTLIATVTVNLESDSTTSPLPGFGIALGITSILLAGLATRRKNSN